MHRFYLPPEQCRGDKLVLTDREAHHALHVLRLKHGDAVTVLDGAGTVCSCEIGSTSKSEVQLTVLQKRVVPASPWRVTLFQALPKGKVFEDIVEKATELGVHQIVPIISQRVVSTPEHPERKLERWKFTAIEAIKQCGLAWLPQVDAPGKLQDWLGRRESFDLSLLGSLQPNSRHPRHWLDAVALKEPLSLSVWIGPEGDFTPDELLLLEKSGVHPISLGPNTLRSATAAIYCLSILNYELQWRFATVR